MYLRISYSSSHCGRLEHTPSLRVFPEGTKLSKNDIVEVILHPQVSVQTQTNCIARTCILSLSASDVGSVSTHPRLRETGSPKQQM